MIAIAQIWRSVAMWGLSNGEGRPSLIAGTLKSVAIVGALSLLAAGWLSSATDTRTLSRLALNASSGAEDPLTTGSLVERGNATRLDPCAKPPARR